VAAENFWGSIVGQLAGRTASVTSIVTDPNADPHTFESSSDDARAFAQADYVIVNGAGYDGWAQQLLSANPKAKRRVLTVAGLLGKKEGDNPHFWYDPDYVTAVVNRIEADLEALEPTQVPYLQTQRTAFDAAMAPYRSRLSAIKATSSGTPVAATESIFVYLADYLGLRLISPPAFMEAVADGNDPPAPSVIEFQNQISTHQARVLVYNRQTSTDLTTNIRNLAAKAGVPTVAVTETIQPPDAPFEQWFTTELEQLQGALSGG
jgi:zinc/manganese transport system substrate-binding protein